MIEHCPSCRYGRLKTIKRKINGIKFRITFCDYCGIELDKRIVK